MYIFFLLWHVKESLAEHEERASTPAKAKIKINSSVGGGGWWGCLGQRLDGASSTCDREKPDSLVEAEAEGPRFQSESFGFVGNAAAAVESGSRTIRERRRICPSIAPPPHQA